MVLPTKTLQIYLRRVWLIVTSGSLTSGGISAVPTSWPVKKIRIGRIFIYKLLLRSVLTLILVLSQTLIRVINVLLILVRIFVLIVNQRGDLLCIFVAITNVTWSFVLWLWKLLRRRIKLATLLLRPNEFLAHFVMVHAVLGSGHLAFMLFGVTHGFIFILCQWFGLVLIICTVF